jgi:hypothetical protein
MIPAAGEEAGMEVAFMRIPERAKVEAVVRLDHGRVFCVPSPGAINRVPPHDLGQFIVELELGWQTGFWGYIARGVVFPTMVQLEGKRPPHGEERSRAAIRGAKDLLCEVEMLAGVIGAIAHDNVDRDPGRAAAMLAKAFWPPHSQAARLPMEDVQRACRAFRQATEDWRALAIGDGLRFQWRRRKHPLAPDNPLDRQRSRSR